MSNEFERCVVDGVMFAAYQNCAINVWAAPSSEVRAAIAKKDELIGYVSSKFREGAVMIIVITPGHPLPNASQRKDLEAFFARWTASWRAIAYVAEGTDLWSMTARTVMTGMRLVQRRNYPTKVFSEVSEAARWAAEYVIKPPGKSADDVVQAVEQIVEDLRRMPG